jgi:hypothetical protein
MVDKIAVGEQVFELSLQITSITDFGMTLEELNEGKAPPPAGVRLDAAVSGPCKGKVNGHMDAIDYLYVRADGRFELHIHGVLTTDDGARIAATATGMGSPNEDGALRLLEYVSLLTAAPGYEWLNTLSIRGEGSVNPASGEIVVRGYAA